jgi:hypothetical protein
MKQIGAEIGVNESRVSQLHARAIQRLRKALGSDCSAADAAALGAAILAFQHSMKRTRMAKAVLERSGVVLPYKAPAPKPAKVAARRAGARDKAPIAAAR